MPLKLAESQSAFSVALLDPETATPANLIRPDGHRADRRFAVYRNNVAVSLIDTLRASFPVTCKLVGEEFFRAMTSEYIRVEIPKSPILSEYGDSFPKFISNFGPARELPYLPDVAALELAWTQSYHAADASSPFSIEGLYGSEAVEAICLFHPSVRLVRSISPVGTIWLGHQSEPFTPPTEWNPEFVMLARPDVEVVLHLLEEADCIFTERLHRGEKIEGAAIAALGSAASFDPGACLVKLLRAGAITSIQLHDHPEGSRS
jgi:hypothetical protein